MYHMVLPWDGADGAPNHEGYHWDIINRGETLQRKLPPELHQDSFGSVGDSLYGEEGNKNINFHLPVMICLHYVPGGAYEVCLYIWRQEGKALEGQVTPVFFPSCPLA